MSQLVNILKVGEKENLHGQSFKGAICGKRGAGSREAWFLCLTGKSRKKGILQQAWAMCDSPGQIHPIKPYNAAFQLPGSVHSLCSFKQAVKLASRRLSEVDNI